MREAGDWADGGFVLIVIDYTMNMYIQAKDLAHINNLNGFYSTTRVQMDNLDIIAIVLSYIQYNYIPTGWYSFPRHPTL